MVDRDYQSQPTTSTATNAKETVHAGEKSAPPESKTSVIHVANLIVDVLRFVIDLARYFDGD